jgi:hypothetical protein
VVQNDRDHGNNLHEHFHFAEIAGFDGEAFRRGNAAQATDQKLAANDYDGYPCRDQSRIKLHQGDERRRDQQLIGEGVEQHAHGRDLATFARKIAVDSVSDGCRDEECGSQQLLFAVHTVEVTTREHPHQQRDAANPGQRYGVGKIHLQQLAKLRRYLDYPPAGDCWAMERKREGTSRHYRTAATPLAEAIAAGVTFPQGVGHMNAERMLIVSVALLALGLGLIFGSAGFSAAYPASGASFQLSLTTTGIPAEAGVAATVFGIVLLLAAFLQAIVEQVRWPHQASKHHGSTAT